MVRYILAECFVLIKQSYNTIIWYLFFISLIKKHHWFISNVKLIKMVLLIPKLRSQFAEFLNDCSLKRLCILYLLTGWYNLGTVYTSGTLLYVKQNATPNHQYYKILSYNWSIQYNLYKRIFFFPEPLLFIKG